MYMITNLDQDFSFMITKEAYDSIGGNAYKFPKPENVKSTREERGKQVPNVELSTSLDHVYHQCLRKLLTEFARNTRTTFKKLQENGSAPASGSEGHRCGLGTVHSTVYISYWQFRCSLTCMNENLTLSGLEELIAAPELAVRDFSLEVLTATIKPRPKDQHALPISRAALEGNREVKPKVNWGALNKVVQQPVEAKVIPSVEAAPENT
jgi:hypothetical protein